MDELRTGQSLNWFGLQDLWQLQLQIQPGMGPSEMDREGISHFREFSATIQLLEERGEAALGVSRAPEQGGMWVTDCWARIKEVSNVVKTLAWGFSGAPELGL